MDKSRKSPRFFTLVLLAFVMFGFAAGPLNAAQIIAEPDMFSSGTDISNLFTGVTLSCVGQTDVSVYAYSAPSFASTGTNVFAYNINSPYWYTSAILRADFASPVSTVSIDFIGNDSSDYGALNAYNSSDTLLETVNTPQLTSGVVFTATINRSQIDIAYITASGIGGDDIHLDYLRAGPLSGLTIIPATGLISSGVCGGPFTPPAITYTLSNDNAYDVNWMADANQSWVTVEPTSGTLLAGNSADVNVSINSDANILLPGYYTDTVSFTDTNSGEIQMRDVELTVEEPPPPPPAPENPNPADEAELVDIYTLLQWNCGGGGGSSELVNGGFETGDFNGWTTVTGPGSELWPWAVTTAGDGYFGNGLPFEGLYYAQNGFDGDAGLYYDIFQEIAIPAGATFVQLEWSERLQWDLIDYGATVARPYEVTLQPAGGGSPTAVLFSTTLPPGTMGDTGYVTHSIDLLAADPCIAGQTIRINFNEYIPETYTGPAQFDLDGASLVMAEGGSVERIELGRPSYKKAPHVIRKGHSPLKNRLAYLEIKEKALASKAEDVEPGVYIGEEPYFAKDRRVPEGTFFDALGQGGPDPCGYTFIDSDEPGGPAFSWIEISGTGTNLNLSDDSYYFPISLPFNFNFYDTDYTQVAVGSNGGVYFVDQYLTLSNVCIPASTTILEFIALYWDDLYPSGVNNVYYQLVGSAPNRILVVQWQHVLHYGSSSDWVTAQVQLHEDGDILMLYADPSAEAGSGATVGIQKSATIGLGYLCNQMSLHSNLAILFTRGGRPTYDVYFDTVDPPVALIHSDLINTYCEPVPYPLDYNTTYYWQVVSKNDACQTPGPVWSFTTIGPPGEIEVTDSIPPPNDLNMPFGEVIIGLSRTEEVTITNSHLVNELVITDINFGLALFEAETPELSIDLPEVDGEEGGSGSWCLPTGWSSPGRPESTLLIREGYMALNNQVDVLLLASGNDPTILRTGLAAFPDIDSVSYFNAASAVPTLAQLNAYDVVVMMTNSPLYNATQTGDVLADYVDGGGRVVEAVASFGTEGGWELAGRFVTGDYEPFGHGPAERFSHSLGSFDNAHPIMNGVTSLTDSLPAGVTLKPQASWVASWSNDVPLVATRGESVVGINIFAFDDGSFSGDVVLLFHNAVIWLVWQQMEGFTLTNIPPLPVVIPPDSNIAFNVIFEPTDVRDYQSSVVIKSNDTDEPNVIVQLSGTGVLDYMAIVPDANFTFSGHPGGPFLPSKTYYYLTNNGVNNIEWTVTGPNWLYIGPASGVINPGGTTEVKVSPNMLARAKGEGVYIGQLLFTDVNTTVQQTRDVILRIYTEPKLWMTPYSFNVAVYQGNIGIENLVIGNGGDGLLDFMLRGEQTGFIPASVPAVSIYSSMVETKKDIAAMAPAKHSFTAMKADSAFAKGRVLVRFAPQSNREYPSLAAKNYILAKAGSGGKLAAARVTKEYRSVRGLSLVRLPDNVAVGDALVTLNNTPGILYAEPDYEVKAIGQNIPNDPLFPDLWGMNNTGQNGGTPDADIDAPEAWETATDAGNIIVAVIDTGVDYTHPDLAANMWTNAAEANGTPGVDDDGNGYIDDIYGYDFVNNDGNPTDDHGHGTHCSGTIGAIGNNGIGVAGVCWNVKIMALKFLNASGSGSTSDAIEAVQYATLMGANLSSNSWGGGSFSQALKDAIDAAGNENRLFVAAAGNDSVDNDVSPHYPSSYTSENIIAVLSTDRYDNMSSFSNYGLTSVDIGAPGSDILSCQPGSSYISRSGTSMATPHVGGAAALVWSFYPSMPYQEVKDLLLQTADNIPSLVGRCVSEGRLNLYNAISEIGVSWLEFLPQSGSALPGDVNDVTVLFHGDMPVGTYQGQILVSSNDPYTPEVNLPVTMIIEPLDYFTELFDAGDNDMANLTLKFMPNGSFLYYSLCISPASEFPVDPAGGTVLSLNDDDYYEVELLGKTIDFYGTSYDTFYIGSNGYITFDSGDTHYFETISEHFTLPRISALFDDLNPSAGGTVSYKELSDRIVVTFENVPEFAQATTNSFQIEVFFWGKIRITFLGIAAVDGLTGLSEGLGVPYYFAESDLSEYCVCGNGDFDMDGDVDFVDYAIFANYWLGQDFVETDECGGADFNKNGWVDYHDLAEFVGYWLEEI